MSGQVVKRMTAGNNIITVEELNKGMFLLEISNEKGSARKLLIIE